MKKLFALIISILMAAALMLPAFAVEPAYVYEYVDELEAVRYRSLDDISRHMKALREGAELDCDENVRNFLTTADRLYFPKRCVVDYEKISSITVAPTYVEMTIETDGAEMSLRQYISDEAGKREYDILAEQVEKGEEGCERSLWQGGGIAEILARTTPVFDGFETCYFWHRTDGGYMTLRAPGKLDPDWYYARFAEAEPCRLFAVEMSATRKAGEPAGCELFYTDENGKSFDGWLYINGGLKYLENGGKPMTGTRMILGDTVLDFDGGGFLIGRHTGWFDDGNIRRFAQNGSLLPRTWICENGMRKYYVNGDCAMATGRETVDGVEYEFGEDGVLIDPWGVGMGVKNVSPTGCTVVFERSGGEFGELVTGVGIIVQRYENNRWRNVEFISDDIAVDALALLINCDGETTLDINWENWYGELPEGRYRVKKTLSKSADAGEAQGETERDYFAYFTIKK